MSTAEVERSPAQALHNAFRALNLTGHVGFDSLPDQLVNKSVSQGFCFNILCVGETGIGKSTMMDTLFNTNFDSTPSTHDLPGVKLKAHTYDLREGSVHLKLTIVNTTGFGDQINKDHSVGKFEEISNTLAARDKCWKPIVDYIDAQFDAYLHEELKIKRMLHTYHDTRVHACLYFIAPTGHSLKALDLMTMKQMDTKVNIIPVIAKADTITKTELTKFKTKGLFTLDNDYWNKTMHKPMKDAFYDHDKLMSELMSNGVHIYQFPTDDETIADTNASMNQHLPFAVVGSNDEVKVGNKMVKARQYPWGTVQVENENHCDFVKLREMLIRTNMEDLREVTHSVHFEMYRRSKLEEMGFSDSEAKSLSETYEQKRQEHITNLQKKEDEMRQMFVIRVKEKESELKDAEKELHNRFDALKKQHADEKQKLEESKKRLEDEMNLFAQQKAQVQSHTSTMTKKKK